MTTKPPHPRPITGWRNAHGWVISARGKCDIEAFEHEYGPTHAYTTPMVDATQEEIDAAREAETPPK